MSQPLTRQDLMRLSEDEIISLLSPEIQEEIQRVCDVFENKLTHITDERGKPVKTDMPFRKDELVCFYDEPFVFMPELEEMGLDEQVQRHIHTMRDPVTWAREVLKWQPRIYQILALRHPKPRKVLRWGRRLGKTAVLAVASLHRCHLYNETKVLGISPYRAQAQLLFNELKKLVRQSEELTALVRQEAQQPAYFISFNNGSQITLFTAGVRSGGGSGSIRGQEADILIVDEADRLDNDSIEAAYIMLQRTNPDKPEKVMWAASTPTGKKERFYEWCVSGSQESNPLFYSLWVPYYCSPFASEAEAEEYKKQYSPNGYRQEVEADWGEEEDGVYPRKFIDLAGKDYMYLRAPRSKGIYLMGVDFDKYGAGSHIVVLKLNDQNDSQFPDKLQVVYRQEIIKSEFTLTTAIEQIKELNDIFKPTWIYIDRGNGEVQLEALHKEGINNPTTGLREKVVGVQFAENITTIDPATQTQIKKPVKPFMVENLRNILEQEKLVFSIEDDDLYKELLGYVQVRTSAYGHPVFGSSVGSDHIHDALILACLAYTLEYGMFSREKPRPSARGLDRELFGLTELPPVGSIDRETKLEKVENRYKNPDAQPLPIALSRTAKLRPKRKNGRIQRRMF